MSDYQSRGGDRGGSDGGYGGGGGYLSTQAGSAQKPAYMKKGVGDKPFVDYKATDDLRRLMTPNGKIYSRKRLGVSAREQRMIAQAIKRARYMALLPYTSATL
jgi:small subunit ribosomal protein S18